MAATVEGTPVAVTWAAGADPAGQSITVPAAATAAYMFWAYNTATTSGDGLASATLNSVSPNETFEYGSTSTNNTATGVAAFYSPATGSRTLDVAWDVAPAFEGAVTIVVFTKDGGAWRDADGIASGSNTVPTVTLTTVAADLVLKLGVLSDAQSPELTASWTNVLTHTIDSFNARVSSIAAAGSSQACDVQDGVGGTDEDFGTVVAIAIPVGGSSIAAMNAYYNQLRTG